jgi:hypothetical protein
MKINFFNSHPKRIVKSGKTPEPGVSPQPISGIARLQRLVGNHAVQRFLAQRSPGGAVELEDDFEKRVQQERSSGHSLEPEVCHELEQELGSDFSGVRVHTSSEADHLNLHIGARAFTTGEDIFFQSGAYDPNSSAGRQLLAHELTHVVQQGLGRVSGGGNRMVLNNPGDTFEQEASQVSKAVTIAAPPPGVQRQQPEEEEKLQMQEEDDKPFQLDEDE